MLIPWLSILAQALHNPLVLSEPFVHVCGGHCGGLCVGRAAGVRYAGVAVELLHSHLLWRHVYLGAPRTRRPHWGSRSGTETGLVPAPVADRSDG